MFILFIVKQRKSLGYCGNFGLYHSAISVAKILRARGIKADVVEAVDNNEIDKFVTLHKPTHVIIEALWVVPEKFEILHKLHRKVTWIVRLHSKIPFLAGEGIAIEWLKAYIKLRREKQIPLHIAGNNLLLTEALTKYLGRRVWYLPNIYPAPHQNESQSCRCYDNIIKIGCFGSIRPLKNTLTQAFAAIQLANELSKKLEFHVNGTRVEQNGENALKNVRALFKGTRHKLIEHDWYDHREFYKLVRSMDLGLQVSLSETFNIVAADFVHAEVPVLVSKEIEWMPFWTKVDPSNVSKMVKRMKKLLKWPRSGLNKLFLKWHNGTATDVWIELFA